MTYVYRVQYSSLPSGATTTRLVLLAEHRFEKAAQLLADLYVRPGGELVAVERLGDARDCTGGKK
jgi:hypothetical protein